MSTLTPSTAQTDLISALSGTWNLDPVHSSLAFSVRHMGVATFRGSFPAIEGELTAHDSGISITGRVAVASIVTADPQLQGHLMSPDFFDADRHPELSFTAQSLTESAGSVTVEGDLTIKGITRPVTLSGSMAGPLADPYGGSRVGLSLSGTIDRTEYGLGWNAPLPGGGLVLSNNVRIAAELELVRS